MLLTWSASSGLNPTLSLDFLTPVLDGRITASGGANGTRVNSSGLIVAATTPRFDYDPVTLAIKGLLVEEARTNLFLNSKIDGSNLSTQGVSVTAQAYTISFYGTGSITLSGAASATINGAGAYPNRVTSTFTPSAGTLTCTVAGTVQFAQIEVGSFATSFIPTAGSTVTRTADSLTMTGTNFSSWFNASEGTFVVEFEPPAVLSTFPVLLGHDSGSTAGMYLFSNTVGHWNGSVDLSIAETVIQGVSNKMALAFSGTTSRAIALNGGTVAEDANSAGSFDGLFFGKPGGAANQVLNSHIRSLRYYPRRLTNAQLQVLT